MKKLFFHIPAIVLCTTLTLVSCTTSKNANTNLPVDIADRPADEDSQKYEQAQLDKLKASIESEVSGENVRMPVNGHLLLWVQNPAAGLSNT
ncbi:hypothetical protein OWR28_02855 [Chryseobacterium sp. 1B4]